MQVKPLLPIQISCVVLLAFVMPVSAFYFQLDYFQTDQMVYEVGETIEMAAKLTADFGSDGWCYVSFTVSEDSQQIYEDAYFIPPSPDPRILQSSFVLTPNTVSPGVNGSTGHAMFDVEMYDKYTHGESETIQINFTRGNLLASPINPLEFEYGLNHTFVFKLGSRYNQDVFEQGVPVMAKLYDSGNRCVANWLPTVNATGHILFDLNNASLPTGDYNLSLESNGTDSFVPFSDSFIVSILPANSSLTVLSADPSVYCLSSNGNHSDSANIVVQHVNGKNKAITDSSLTWSTAFSNGTIDHLQDGKYNCSIPFEVPPGNYSVLIQATNPSYASVNTSLIIEAETRPIDSNISIKGKALAGKNVEFILSFQDLLTNENVANHPISLEITNNNYSVSTSLLYTNESGILCYNYSIPQEMWGESSLLIISNESIFYTSRTFSYNFTIYYLPVIITENVTQAFLDSEIAMNATVLNPMNMPLTDIQIVVTDYLNNTLTTALTDFEGVATLSWIVNSSYSTGPYDFCFHLGSSPAKYSEERMYWHTIDLHHSLVFKLQNSSLDAFRNSTLTLSFQVVSESTFPTSIDILLTNDNLRCNLSIEVSMNSTKIANLNIPTNISLGPYQISYESLNTSYMFRNPSYFTLIVIDYMNASCSNFQARYNDELSFDLLMVDWDNTSISTVYVSAEIEGVRVATNIFANLTHAPTIQIGLPLHLSPGPHQLLLNVCHPYRVNQTISTQIVIWMETRITITTIEAQGSPVSIPVANQDTLRNISDGSITRPPPIFLNGTTLTSPSIARDTSRLNCPKFSSGTNSCSTVDANFKTSSSGNGQSVLSLIDFNETCSWFSVITCSTVLEVHPKEIIPHSALSGPVMTVSLRNRELFLIFVVIRRTNLS